MSIRKLQDLLNANAQGGGNTHPKLVSHVNRSPSFNQQQYSPMANGASRSPSYHNIPGVQQMFYHPQVKPQVEPVCPSPMFQVPASKKHNQSYNSMFQGSRFTAAETNPTNNISNFNHNNDSNSVNSLLNQLQNQFGTQPRNLEELLQKSFSSAPNNSVPQSPFMSSVQSPFIGGNNFNSHHAQQSIGSEMSNLFAPMTLLETSLQNSNLMNNHANKNQSNESVNKALVLQLAQILKQESESKIKSAIAELILKYKALGLLTNLSGNEMVDLQGLIQGEISHHNMSQYQQPQEITVQVPQQNLVSLSCGIPMNQLQRNEFAQHSISNMPTAKNNIHDHHRIQAARRELFSMDEAHIVHPSREVLPQSIQNIQNMHQNVNMQRPQSTFHTGTTQGLPISPVNNLNTEMNSLTLNNSMNQTQYTNFGLSILSAPDNMEDFTNADLGTLLKHKVGSEEEIPGVYNKYERINKILKYKNKIRKWRDAHPVKRVFKGRSQVAGQKPRIKGKFVTIEEYQQHVTGACKNEHGHVKEEEDF